MATAKPQPLPPSPARSPRWRKWRARAVIVLVLLALGLAWFWRPLTGYAQAGAAYGARVACSCRFVAGRGLEDCRKDFVAGMELIVLSEDVAAKRVTARLPLLSRQTAQFRPGEGCVLDRWED